MCKELTCSCSVTEESKLNTNTKNVLLPVLEEIKIVIKWRDKQKKSSKNLL